MSNKEDMFSLCTAENSRGEKCFYFKTGNNDIIEKSINKFQKKGIEEIIKVSSDPSAISDLKYILKSRPDILLSKSSKIISTGGCCNDVMNIILNTFFHCHSCKSTNIHLCKSCHQFEKIDGKVIGKVMVGFYDVLTCLSLEADWTCQNCRGPYEFSLAAWSFSSSVSQRKNYICITAPRNSILKKISSLRKIYKDAHLLLHICPSLKAQNISKYLKNNFYAMKIQHIDGKNKDLYTHLIIKLFLHYFIPNEEVHLELFGVCKYCHHIFLLKGQKDLGYILILNQSVIDILEIESNWSCKACETSSLVIYALETPDGGTDYYIASSNETVDTKCYLNKLMKRYSNTYTFIKLFYYITKDFFLSQVHTNKKLNLKGSKLHPKISKDNLAMELTVIYNRKVHDRIREAYRVCTLCNRHVTARYGYEYGGSWNRSKSYQISRYNFYCQRHCVHKFLFWNTGGNKSFFDVVDDKTSIIANSEVICLYEAHRMKETDIKFADLITNRRKIAESTAFVSSGATQGGLMILINQNLIFNYKQLSLSDRILFIEIDFTVSTLILGVVYWPILEKGDSNEFDEFLNELDDLITAHNKPLARIIIGGHFSCRIGNLNNHFIDEEVFLNWKLYLKRKSMDIDQDERGEKLAELMKKHKFVLCNGRTISDCPGKSSDPSDVYRVTDLVWVSEYIGYEVDDLKILEVCKGKTKSYKAQYLELTEYHQ